MKYLPQASIKVPANRQRADFAEGPMMELVESIKARGLLQALVVREGGVLVAGERRLRAIIMLRSLFGECLRFGDQEVPAGTIPCLNLGELSDLEAMEAELDENTKRKDLTWQELAAATHKLHTLRSEQAFARGERQTVADTAEEITGRSDGYYQESTRQKILVAAHLGNPAIANAKDLREAFKALKREEETQQNIVLAESVGRNYSSMSHSLILADCVKWMTEAEASQFDCIVTDPPYGINADEFGDGAGRLMGIIHNYKDDPETFFTLITAAAVGIARVAKPAAHLYLCCDIDHFHFLRSLFSKEEYGRWSVFRTPLINYKTNSGRVPLPEHGPRRCYETILYAYRGDKRTTAIYQDIIGTAGDENLGHGAQKPVALYTDLLRRSTRPGDRVLDPFAGTGPIFPAAHSLRLLATGVEREKAYYGIAVKRLADIDLTPITE